MVVLLFREKAKEACLAKPLQDRERERKEKVLWSVLQSRCQGKVDGTALRVILFRLTENSILMNEISENTLNVELNKLFLVKFHFRENYSQLSTTWRSQIWSEEIQSTHYLSHCVGLNLKDHSSWRLINEQIKLSKREYFWVANWRWRAVFTRNATQELAKNLKNWEDAAISPTSWTISTAQKLLQRSSRMNPST